MLDPVLKRKHECTSAEGIASLHLCAVTFVTTVSFIVF